MATVSDVKLACEALKASGVKSCATWSLLLPFGRRGRLQAMLRKRRAVLEAKNGVLDCLFRFQKALEPMGLTDAPSVQRAMTDPEKRRLIIAVGLSRASLEDELGRYGLEAAAYLDQALSELVAERRIVKASGASGVPGSEVHLVIHQRGRGRYDISLLSRLLQRGQTSKYGDMLRARQRTRTGSDEGREYRL
jgi:hypothetical protein